MKPLSKGDTCRVRLYTGEVVEAVYDKPHYQFCSLTERELRVKKSHLVYVLINGARIKCSAGKYSPSRKNWRVRFVGPSCDLVPVGVSV